LNSCLCVCVLVYMLVIPATLQGREYVLKICVGLSVR
jgi:hypothetical protein